MSTTSQPFLVVLDMDSTFIQQEVIDLLANHAGVGAEVAAITAAAMAGYLDFSSSLGKRVALLEGLDESIFETVRGELTLSQGAKTLITSLHQHGSYLGIVSGGFENVIAPLLTDLKVDTFRANVLEVVDGKLTGRLLGPVIDRTAKADFLKEKAAEFGINLGQTVAVGDGANDLGMIEAAAIGIAFNAKQVVAEQADHQITDGDLTHILDVIGVARAH